MLLCMSQRSTRAWKNAVKEKKKDGRRLVSFELSFPLAGLRSHHTGTVRGWAHTQANRERLIGGQRERERMVTGWRSFSLAGLGSITGEVRDVHANIQRGGQSERERRQEWIIFQPGLKTAAVHTSILGQAPPSLTFRAERQAQLNLDIQH